VESHILGPDETQRLYPLMNVKDIYGTLYSTSDGTIDPAGYCTALVRAATRLGAKVPYQTSFIKTYDDFLPRDVTQSVAMPQHVVVCPSMTCKITT